MTDTVTPAATPLCDRLREQGGWNPNWEPFYALDPDWTERFMSMGMFVLLSPSHRGEQNEGDDGQFQRTEKIPESTGEALCVG